MIEGGATKVCAGFVLAIGLTAMVGWMFDVPLLYGWLAGEISMKFPSALSLVLASGILFLVAEHTLGRTSLPEVVLPGLTMFTLLIMASLLAAYFFQINTGIEKLFIAETVGAVKTIHPGMPAPPTMISLILICIVSLISLLGGAYNRRIFQVIGSFILVLGVCAIVGYVLGVPQLYYKFQAESTPIAFNTALAFAFMGLGFLLIPKRNPIVTT